jgi:hypothetical protein
VTVIPSAHRSFDAVRAYDHTRALCYPRRVGTPRERWAARYILRQFAALGLARRREPFAVSHFATEIGCRLVFGFCAVLVLLGAWLAPAWAGPAALCWGWAGFLINAPWRLDGGLGRRWPPLTSSANLVATLPGSPPDAPARVVFMAHYDTKSQFWPTGVRVGLVSAATLLCGLLGLLGLVAAAGLPGILAAAHPWAVALLVAALLAGLLVNGNGNRCPGALDNGSAVGTLLELARTWRPRPEAPVEVVWVASGSEEVGLDGARHLLRLHGSWWQDKPTLLINLESVGAGARVYLAGEPRALRLAEEVADGLALPHARLRVLGAGMDHEPFAARRLPALSILGDVVRNALALHSPRDNMSLIEPPALERAGRLAAHLAWRWAELHRPPVTVPVDDPDARLGDEEPVLCSPAAC